MTRNTIFCIAGIFLILLSGCGPVKKNPIVELVTTQGTILIELYPDKAPLTVANFLSYVDRQLYDGASFYRNVRLENQPNPVKIEVIQGGLDLLMNVDSLPPIPHESTDQTGILHTDGVVSMARYGPGTATSEFFICVGDQPALDFGGERNPDGYGFAAFGKVIDGMGVVRKIHLGATEGDFQLLIKPVEIVRICRY
jgi:peptidyl-prolyl cis-trans isomerase A (cyclophilin A)